MKTTPASLYTSFMQITNKCIHNSNTPATCRNCNKHKGSRNEQLIQISPYKSRIHERNKKIASMIAIYKIKEIAAQIGMTYQRVSQILIEAEGKGELDRKELTLQRKRRAIEYADSYNNYAAQYRPHIQL